MRSPILVCLLLWSLGVASVAAQKVRGSGATLRKTRRLNQNRTKFVSYFQIDYLANSYGDIDFTLVGQALAIAYNNLMEPRFSNEEDALEYTLYDDPFMRRMEAVEVLKVEGLRRLSDEKGDSRELQSSSLRNLNVYLRVTGSCRGCSSRSKFTNQVSRRLSKARKESNRKLQAKSGVNKGGGKGGSGPVPSPPPVLPPPVPTPTENAQTPPPVIITPAPVTPAPVTPPPVTTPAPVTPAPVTPPPVTTPAPVTPAPVITPAPVTPAPVTPAPVTAPPTENAATPPPFDDPSTLPTEEELRVAYAIEIHRWEFDIIDVTSLDEVDAISGGPTNYTFVQMATTNNCGGSSNQISSCP